MRRFLILPALLLLLLLSAPPLWAGTLSIVGQSTWVRVDKIYDGDTFRAADGEKIRLLGINTPEVTHGSEPGQPMGNEATKALQQLIAGETVRLAFDKQRHDVYGRLLAQVYLHDGSWVNGELVRRGFAHVYTFTPNLRWASDLLKLERPARRQHLGIWSTARFAVTPAARVTSSRIGEFHVVTGRVNRIEKNGFGFRIARLNISIPRAYRPYFTPPPRLQKGWQVVVHGVVRAGHHGRLYLALHSPTDLEIIKQ